MRWLKLGVLALVLAAPQVVQAVDGGTACETEAAALAASRKETARWRAEALRWHRIAEEMYVGIKKVKAVLAEPSTSKEKAK